MIKLVRDFTYRNIVCFSFNYLTRQRDSILFHLDKTNAAHRILQWQVYTASKYSCISKLQRHFCKIQQRDQLGSIFSHCSYSLIFYVLTPIYSIHHRAISFLSPALAISLLPDFVRSFSFSPFCLLSAAIFSSYFSCISYILFVRRFTLPVYSTALHCPCPLHFQHFF